MDFCFWQYGGLDPLKGLPKILKIFVLVVMPLIIFFYANFFSFLISFLIGETNHLSYWLSCILHLADCFLVYHLTLECSFMLYIFGKQSFMWMLNEILVKFFFFLIGVLQWWGYASITPHHEAHDWLSVLVMLEWSVCSGGISLIALLYEVPHH